MQAICLARPLTIPCFWEPPPKTNHLPSAKSLQPARTSRCCLFPRVTLMAWFSKGGLSCCSSGPPLSFLFWRNLSIRQLLRLQCSFFFFNTAHHPSQIFLTLIHDSQSKTHSFADVEVPSARSSFKITSFAFVRKLSIKEVMAGLAGPTSISDKACTRTQDSLTMTFFLVPIHPSLPIVSFQTCTNNQHFHASCH